MFGLPVVVVDVTRQACDMVLRKYSFSPEILSFPFFFFAIRSSRRQVPNGSGGRGGGNNELSLSTPKPAKGRQD